MAFNVFKVGDKVRVEGNNDLRGEIVEISGNNARILLLSNPMILSISLKKLSPLEQDVSIRKDDKRVKLLNIQKKSLIEFEPIVDLHGLRVHEALQAVAKLIDQCLLHQRSELKIIHGKGTGTLRKAVKEFLVGHEMVKEVKDLHPNPGGLGVTYAELR